jgi:hypothetical protein
MAGEGTDLPSLRKFGQRYDATDPSLQFIERFHGIQTLDLQCVPLDRRQCPKGDGWRSTV